MVGANLLRRHFGGDPSRHNHGIAFTARDDRKFIASLSGGSTNMALHHPKQDGLARSVTVTGRAEF